MEAAAIGALKDLAAVKHAIGAMHLFLMDKVSSRRLPLVGVDEVPLSYREEAIERGYRRPPCSLSAALLSAVTPLNNETINFWTHFLPFWYFAYMLYFFASSGASYSSHYYWPFLAYLLTVCNWPLVSAVAHLLHVMSESARHICFFTDYLSLSWYAFGVGVAYHAYSFDSIFFDTWYSNVFPYASAIACLCCTALSCYTRLIPKERFWLRKVGRLLAFVIPYLTVNAPLFERVVRCQLMGAQCAGEQAISLHLMQFVFIFLGMLFYSLHVPERLWPGRFDLFGHSHQLFHVFGVLCSYFQMWAVYYDLQNRRALFAKDHWYPQQWACFDMTMVLAVLLANWIIVFAFAKLVLRRDKLRQE